jgi:hypothetical protein
MSSLTGEEQLVPYEMHSHLEDVRNPDFETCFAGKVADTSGSREAPSVKGALHSTERPRSTTRKVSHVGTAIKVTVLTKSDTYSYTESASLFGIP